MGKKKKGKITIVVDCPEKLQRLIRPTIFRDAVDKVAKKLKKRLRKELGL